MYTDICNQLNSEDVSLEEQKLIEGRLNPKTIAQMTNKTKLWKGSSMMYKDNLNSLSPLYPCLCFNNSRNV